MSKKAKATKSEATKTIKSVAVPLILKGGLSTDEIIAAVKKAFPESAFQATHVSWYRSRLRADGEKVPDLKRERGGDALKKAAPKKAAPKKAAPKKAAPKKAAKTTTAPKRSHKKKTPTEAAGFTSGVPTGSGDSTAAL